MKKTKSIFEFKENADRYYEAALDASENGNLFFALKYANEAARIEPTCLEYRFLIGELYYEMGLYERAIDINLEILALDPEVEESYYYCLRAFGEQRKYDAAFFYLQEGLKHGLLESGVIDAEQLNELKMPRNDFHVVSEQEEAEDALFEARTRFEAGYPAAAIEVLNGFKPDSPLYEESLVLKADCYGSDRADSAVLALEERYRVSRSPLLGAALAHAYFDADRRVEAELLLDGIELAERASFDELKRFALAYSDLDRLDDALKSVNEACDIEPNDPNLLLLKASILSRADRFEAALDAVQELLILDPLDSVAMFYNERLQDRKPMTKNIELPKAEAARRVEYLLDWADSDEETLKKPVTRNRLAILRWALKKRVLTEYDEFDILSAISESEDVEVLLRNLCVDHDISWDVRRVCAAVLCFCVDAGVMLRIGDQYIRLDCRAPSKVKNNDFLMRAWSIALATLAFSAKDYEKPLRDIFSRLANAKLDPSLDEARLAAVVIVGFVLHLEQVFTDPEHEGILSGLIRDLKEIETPLKELLPVMFPVN